MNKNHGRGDGFTRAENEYIVAKCLRTMAGKERTRDIDIANILGRGKNNISIRRRKLGFMYKNDAQTGEAKIVYKRPKTRDYYINIERLDVNRAIAVTDLKIKKKELLKQGENIDNLKLSDFYPDNSFDTYDENGLKIISGNIEVDQKKKSNKRDDIFNTDYDDKENIEYFNSDRFITANIEEEDSEVSNSSLTNLLNADELIKDKEKKIEDSKEDLKEFSAIAFTSIKKSFDNDEWQYFKSRWKAYMTAYGDQFDEVSDWDDLVGYLSEQIKRNRLLQKEKDYQEDYSKELSLCIGRLNDYKKNLATSRNSRIQQKVDTRLNIADIIKLFEDNDRFVELNYRAEAELAKISQFIRKELINPNSLKDFSKIDGNESALLLGLPSSYEELSKLLE